MPNILGFFATINPMTSPEQNIFEDKDIHNVEILGLPEVVEEQLFEKELDKQDDLEQMFGGSIKEDDRAGLKRSENAWDRFFKKGWQKIKPSKAEIQEDTAITEAQRQSPKNQ
ncbi:MAG: hypothetical protein WAV25_03220 [Minisyncoccia bacterium]